MAIVYLILKQQSANKTHLIRPLKQYLLSQPYLIPNSINLLPADSVLLESSARKRWKTFYVS